MTRCPRKVWLGFATLLVVSCSGTYAKKGMLRSGVNAKKIGDQKQQILANLVLGSGAGAAPGSGAGAAPKANGAQPNANQQPVVAPMVVPTTQLVPQNPLAQNQGNGVCISVKKCSEIQ